MACPNIRVRVRHESDSAEYEPQVYTVESIELPLEGWKTVWVDGIPTILPDEAAHS